MATKINNIIVKAEDDGIRLDRWFARNLPEINFVLIAKSARKGQVRVNGKRVKPSTRVATGQEVRFPEFPTNTVKPTQEQKQKHPKFQKWLKVVKENIIYKDDDILAINKVAGLAVQGGNKISVSLDDILAELQFESVVRPKLVHRIDKETSGVLIIARNNKAAAELSELIRKRHIDKTYLAILCNVPHPLWGEITLPLHKDKTANFEMVKHSVKGKTAITKYKVLDYVLNTASLVEFKLITGKTHQLRVHSTSINCPILGDSKYNITNPSFEYVAQLYLHSYQVKFEYKGKKITIKAPIPKYFKNTLSDLGMSLAYIK